MLRTAMVFARGTDDSPTGAGTVEIKNSGHLRLRHNLEGPETVITPRLCDELRPFGAPALGQDQRGQAVLVGHVPERACPASSGRVLAPQTIPIRHRQRFLVRITDIRDGTRATGGPDGLVQYGFVQYGLVQFGRRDTQAGMSSAAARRVPAEWSCARTLPSRRRSALTCRRRRGRSRPVTRRAPFALSHRLTSGDAGCSRFPVAVVPPASSGTATPSESATSPRARQVGDP